MKKRQICFLMVGLIMGGALTARAESIRQITVPQALRNRKPEYQWTSLHWAAREGNIEDVRRLVMGGAELEARDALYRTPLHVAAQFGHREAVAALLDAGADSQARDQWNLTPLGRARLQKAARGWDMSDVKALLTARSATTD